jgi:hypothetical protein
VFEVLYWACFSLMCLLVLAAEFWWQLRRGSRPGIEARLRRHPEGRINSRIRIPSFIAIWNPAKASVFDGFWGRGQATYWLDGEEYVHAEWTPRNGVPQTYVSPSPLRGARPSAGRNAARRGAAAGCALYVVATVTGAAIGYAVAGSGQRTALTVVGGYWALWRPSRSP